MRRNFLLTTLLFVVLMLTSTTPVRAQIDDLFFSDFIKNEATYMSQPLKVPRSSLSNPVTLRAQLNLIVGNLNFTEATIVQSYMDGGIECRKCEDINALLDMDPIFLSFDKGKKRLIGKQFEINTSIYFTYLDENGKKASLIMHMTPRGLLDTVIYTRTTIILPSTAVQDDLRTFKSQSAAVSASYLTVYEVRNLKKEMAKFQNIYKSTIDKYNKNLELNEYEGYCMKGLREQDNLGGYVSYANWLYDDSRYYDAYINFLPAYDAIKSYIRPGDKEFDDIFYEISHKMGMSLWNLGYNDSAEYYLSVAAFGSETAKVDYAECMKTRAFDVEEFTGSGLYLGQVLPLLFDMDKYCVMQGVSQIGGESALINARDSVWNFDLKSLCTPAPSHITISVTRSKMEKEGYVGTDMSRLCYSNNIIMTSHQVSDDLWRVDAVLPNYKNFDQRKPGDDDFNRPVAVSFIISNKPLEYTVLNSEAPYSFLLDKYKYGLKLEDEYKYMESLITMMSVLRHATDKSVVKDSQDNWNGLVAYTYYKIGYCYSELKQSIKAMPYLAKACLMTDDTAVIKEYVSNLSNMVDPRAFYIIEQLLSEKPQDKAFENLLNRRYAFLLIEYGRLDEAEAILKNLLNDPQSREFAQEELEYIKSLKRR